ncbi:hypothetical protein CR513_57437, partial [Mucuna pruriens]
LGTEKPRVTRGDRLEYQLTLVDLILSVLANRGGSSPSTMAIVVEDGIIESRPYPRPSRNNLYRDHLGSVSSENNSVSAELFDKRLRRQQLPNWRRCRGHKLLCVFVCQVNRAESESNTDPLYTFDPEIELTLRRLRKIRSTAINTSSSIDSVINSDLFCTDNFVTSTNNFTKPRQMENHDRTLKELATPNVVYQPWCIQYPQLEPAQTYELKSGLIHLLPKFHGLAGEDPYKHLKEFHVVCSTMRPQGIPEDYIKMKAFPFSLDGAAKDWLYLQPALFNT